MVHAKQFQANPDLYVFLPIFYIVWSDSLLTPTELSTLKKLIESQEWLSPDEKKFLINKINPSEQPSSDELKEWYNEIKKVLDPELPEKSDSLVETGIKLAKLHKGARTIEALKNALRSLYDIEDSLGLIGKEAIFHFYPGSRKTITQKQGTNPSFDVAKMTAMLDGDQASQIQKVKTLLSDPAFAYIDTDNLNIYREQVLRWCKLLADRGMGSIAYPKDCGGQDDMASYFTVMETLSYHDLSLVVKFGVQFGLFGMSIYFLGTQKHHQKYLKQVGTLELPGCFAMTETGHGSNVRGIETTATYNHNKRSFTIHTPNRQAQKEYIGNAALHGQMATVFAKLIINGKDYGVTALLVPIRDKNGKTLAGVTIEDCGRKMGLNGVDNGVIRFEQVEIPYENMLDRFASVDEAGNFQSPISSDNRRFFTMLGTLVGGRIGIPRAGLSAAKSGLTIAVRYGDQRRQFGPEGGAEVPILNYRTHQRRLMPLLAKAYALHFALQYLTKRFLARTEKDMQEIEALAAGLKAVATWNATDTLQECREACGGKGYLSENRISALKNDTDIFTTFEGDNTVLLQLVAKSRLTEFKQEFSNMDLFGILNFVAGQAKTTITEMNPVIVRSTDESHLVDSDFHLSAFRYRERAILTSAAKRLKRHIDSGMDSFDAFNVVQHHLIQVGIAYVERIILEKFVEQVNATTDEGCHKVLQRLCQLFALTIIDEHKGWYLENGYMEGVKTKAIEKTLNQLCWDVRQDAVPLVDAFAIPDACLAAPIAVRS